MHGLFNDGSAIFKHWDELSKALKNRRNRQLLLFESTVHDVTIVQAFVNNLTELRVCLLPSMNSNADRRHQIHALLGKEFDTVLFDATSGFDAELFVAVAGTLVSGGSLILLTPPLAAWSEKQDQLYQQLLGGEAPVNPSLFIQRLTRLLQTHCSIISSEATVQSTHANLANAIITANSEVTTPLKNEKTKWFDVQQRHVEQLTTQALGKDESVGIVMADRGRGKSALLGQIAARLSAVGLSVTVTANHKANTEVLQRHFLSSATAGSILPFVSVDLAAAHKTDVLLVEEAGSIPLAVLTELANAHSHTIFATTVHGYEGAGRSFALRFTRWLDKHKSGWMMVTPTQPIRWAEGDPVETFVNELGILAPEERLANTEWDQSQIMTRPLSAEELLNNETLLVETYSLLSQAHYQTTPNDLRHMLDRPDMQAYALFAQNKQHTQLLGVALLALEGNIEESLHERILDKTRRLYNQLLPQLMAQCINQSEPLSERYARVTRIAIHPSLQRQGLGSRLLCDIKQQLQKSGTAMGASFGAQADTLGFWLAQDFLPIHIGHRTNSRSGVRSFCVLHASAKQSQTIEFAQSLLLANQSTLSALANVDTEEGNFKSCRDDALTKLQQCENNYQITDAQLRGMIRRYCDGQRNYSDTAFAIVRCCRTERPSNVDNALKLLSRASILGKAHHSRQDMVQLNDIVIAWLNTNPYQSHHV